MMFYFTMINIIRTILITHVSRFIYYMKESSNFVGPADEAIDWDNFVAEQSKRMRDKEDLYLKLMIDTNNKIVGGSSSNNFFTKIDASEIFHCELMSYNKIPWFNYWPMLEVRTENYFCNFGTQTLPLASLC